MDKFVVYCHHKSVHPSTLPTTFHPTFHPALSSLSPPPSLPHLPSLPLHFSPSTPSSNLTIHIHPPSPSFLPLSFLPSLSDFLLSSHYSSLLHSLSFPLCLSVMSTFTPLFLKLDRPLRKSLSLSLSVTWQIRRATNSSKLYQATNNLCVSKDLVSWYDREKFLGFQF